MNRMLGHNLWMLWDRGLDSILRPPDCEDRPNRLISRISLAFWLFNTEGFAGISSTIPTGRAAEAGRPGRDRRAFTERGEIRRGVPVVRYLTSDCNPTSVRRQAEPIPAKLIFATSRQPPRYGTYITYFQIPCKEAHPDFLRSGSLLQPGNPGQQLFVCRFCHRQRPLSPFLLRLLA